MRIFDKCIGLLQLARKRQTARWPGYRNIADYHGGAYDCDHVSPYTKSAGNLDARIMVMLQDWCSDEFLSGPVDGMVVKLGHSPDLPTNKNLKALLTKHFKVSLADCYATNLFPFIKPGGMNTSIPSKDMVRAAREFTLPQIEIVKPRLVICLGLVAFNAISRAVGRPKLRTLDEAIRSPFKHVETLIFCQAHTGQLGRNGRNRGGVDRVDQDWAEMARKVRAQ